MKKTRYIPYGYEVCGGRTVVNGEEAEVIRQIFDAYLEGSSLKEIADALTRKKIPYTERTVVWDRALVARILGNAKYTGIGEYDRIVDEKVYEKANLERASRQQYRTPKNGSEIKCLSNRVRCAECGSPMVRRGKAAPRWTCSNEACGTEVQISDHALLQKITVLMNRVIEDPFLLISPKRVKKDIPAVARLQREINRELERETPSQQIILDLIMEMANQMYEDPEYAKRIAGFTLKRKALRMKIQNQFNEAYFSELVESVLLDASGSAAVLTKTGTKVREVE